MRWLTVLGVVLLGGCQSSTPPTQDHAGLNILSDGQIPRVGAVIITPESGFGHMAPRQAGGHYVELQKGGVYVWYVENGKTTRPATKAEIAEAEKFVAPFRAFGRESRHEKERLNSQKLIEII